MKTKILTHCAGLNASKTKTQIEGMNEKNNTAGATPETTNTLTTMQV
jgi:hypothetical protein